jgi:hypothetical protein
MPLLTGYAELDLTGMEIESLSWKGARLKTKFGNGYGAFAVAGSASGLWGWEIASECLPDDDSYGDLIEGVPRFVYYFEFVKAHTTGTEEIFIIEWRGEKYHASFEENSLSGTMQTIDLFSLSGVKIEMRRVPGVTYNANGSILVPYFWLEADQFTDANGTAETLWSDWTPNDNDLTLTGGPIFKTNAINGMSVVRFDSSNDYGSKTFTGTKLFYDIFMVVKHRGATWGALNVKALSDDTYTFLQGASGAATFTDLGLTAYEYRKNGTLLAANGGSPMNVFAVLHLRFTSGQPFTNAIGIAKSLGEGYNCPLDIAAFIVWDTPLSATQFASVATGLATKYADLINEPWGWYQAEVIGVADGATPATWTDQTTNGHDLTLANGPTVQLGEVNDLAVVRFDGSNDYATLTLASPVVFYDIFMVVKHRGATWGGTNRVLISDIDNNFVYGTASGATFDDPSITGYEYRKNGVLLADNGGSPMNVFAVLHFRFTAGQSFDGALGIAKSLAGGFQSPVDIAEIVMYDTLQSADQYADRTDDLMRRNGIS